MADNNTTEQNLKYITSAFDGVITALGTAPFALGRKYTDSAEVFSASFGVMNNTITGSIAYQSSPEQLADLEEALLGVVVGIVAPVITVALIPTAIASAPLIIIVAGTTAFAASIYGDETYELYTDVQKAFFDWMIKNNYDLEISDDVNSLWQAFKNWVAPRRDPLVLDLDGDGIETLGVNATTHVVFDYDGDGVKTGTGWIKGDDGFVVLDRNGNGTIDNGGELFGDQTLVNGAKASDGFAALSAEDTNKNGKFDAGDANFTNVRIWQDTNADGISQAGELHTLNELGVTSINLTSTTSNTVSNGNVQIAAGTYTKTNGDTGASGTLNLTEDTGTAGNLNFSQNPFYSEFTDPLTLTDTALALPDMQGSGMVRVNNDKFEKVRRVA